MEILSVLIAAFIAFVVGVVVTRLFAPRVVTEIEEIPVERMVYKDKIVTKTKEVEVPAKMFVVKNETRDEDEFGTAQQWMGADLEYPDGKVKRHLFTQHDLKVTGRRAEKQMEEKQPPIKRKKRGPYKKKKSENKN